MKKLSREKIALVVFVALVMAGLGLSLFYVAALGRNWNVAANNIDDATGSLDGYTAIIYAGLAEEPETALDRAVQRYHNESTQKLNDQGEQGATSTENEVTASEITPEAKDVSQPPTVDAVRTLYLEKNASTLVLDVNNPAMYDEQTVVTAGNYTFGVLYYTTDRANQDRVASKRACVPALPIYDNATQTLVLPTEDDTAPVTYLEQRVAAYEEADVDFVVAIVDDLSVISAHEGVDIVISTQEEGLVATGVSSDGVFYVDAALRDEVGTLLISPSRTITAKDITSL